MYVFVVIGVCIKTTSLSSVMCIVDECLYLTGILLSIDLNAATDIDSPGVNLLNRLRDVLRCQATSQDYRRLLCHFLCYVPIMCLARATPFSCWSIK